MCRQRVPPSWNSTRSRFRHVAVERERQVDDRVLQPLAHPHRHDLHRRGVAVQPPVAFRCAAAVFALGAQPVPQRGQACSARGARRPAAAASCAPGRSCAARRPATTARGRPCRAAAQPRRSPRHRAPGRGRPTPATSRRPGRSAHRRPRQGFPRSRRRTSSPRRHAPRPGGAAGRTPPAGTASRRPPRRRTRRSRRCTPTECRPRSARGGTRGRPCAFSTITAMSPASQRLAVERRAAGEQGADVGGEVGADVLAEVVDRRRSEFRCGRTSPGAPPATGTGRCAARPPAGAPW